MANLKISFISGRKSSRSMAYQRSITSLLVKVAMHHYPTKGNEGQQLILP